MKALVVGQSVYNVFTSLDKFPAEGSETNITDITECGGGTATNIAYMLSKYGVDSYIGSAVGDDTFGNIIKRELEGLGVHTEYMESAYEKRTTMSLINFDKENKMKTTYNIAKEDLFLKKSEFQFEPDIVYVDGFDYGASLSALNSFGSKPTIIGAKYRRKETMELCKYCQYIIATREFAEWVTGVRIDFTNPGSLVTMYSTFLNKFPGKNIIVTLGDKGALYINNNQIKVMPGLQLDVIDNTGAGDFFRGAFVYALLQNYDIERAVTFANIAGGLASGKLGTREAIPEISDIMTCFEQKFASNMPSPDSNNQNGVVPQGQVSNQVPPQNQMPNNAQSEVPNGNVPMQNGVPTQEGQIPNPTANADSSANQNASVPPAA